MDSKALELASRFALPPNSLGYCGKNSAPEKFKNCILGNGCGGVDEEINKFIVLGPYLETLEKITGKDKFSYDVVEAYWLGNNELRKARQKDYKTLLNVFARQGVPPWLIEELRQVKPNKFIPYHLFQVLYIGVGRASGSVPYNLDTINNCMIRWGDVGKIGSKYLSVYLNSLEKKGKYFKLVHKKGRYTFRADFLPGLKIGDTVAVHWKQVVKKLTDSEVKNLEYWTKEVISSVQG